MFVTNIDEHYFCRYFGIISNIIKALLKNSICSVNGGIVVEVQVLLYFLNPLSRHCTTDISGCAPVVLLLS